MQTERPLVVTFLANVRPMVVKLTHERKPTQKNESELGDICISFIYRSLSFYRQHLKITDKLCTSVRLEVTGISYGTLLSLTPETSLNANLVNFFNSTLDAGCSSLSNLMKS